MTFDEWLNKTLDNKSTLEKVEQELVHNRYNDNHSFWKTVLKWLKAAYFIGYVSGKEEVLNTKKLVNN